MTRNKTPLISFIWLIIFWSLMAISPINRHDWFMENILFFISFAILSFTYSKFQFSNTSYILITSFFTLHLIGAHYTYSEVPFGFYLAEAFEFERNHFDRITHFAFGLLLTYPFRELLIRLNSSTGLFSLYFSINIILAFSGLFEIIEWLFVMAVNPELGDAYLGTQGDIWDAQKDMAIAVFGSILAASIMIISTKPKVKI